jgi:uncharacterized protein YvpB
VAPPPPPGPPPILVNVPWHHQTYNLSCEEMSLSMVLEFSGHLVTESDILNFITVDSAHPAAGVAGGGDPYANFVGDPNGSEVRQTGYGTYWPPIKAAAAHFGATVSQAGEGIAPSTLYAAVKAGHPVQVWVTFGWQPHARADYVAFDGKTIPYAGPWEHAMVLSGISSTGVRVNDPDSTTGGAYWVSFSTFESSYAVYNQMAVIFN